MTRFLVEVAASHDGGAQLFLVESRNDGFIVAECSHNVPMPSSAVRDYSPGDGAASIAHDGVALPASHSPLHPGIAIPLSALRHGLVQEPAVPGASRRRRSPVTSAKKPSP